MNPEVGSLRCMAPSLGIPPHRHYDPTDIEDARLRLEWAKFLFRAGYRLRYPQTAARFRCNAAVKSALCRSVHSVTFSPVFSIRKMCQETTATAILLFHRFLIQERVGKHRRSRDVILTTCLFLAGKVTEAPRRLRDVINVLHMLTSTTQNEPPLLDKAYWTMKERIVEFEQVLLRTINFAVDPPDPYRLLLNYARSLRLDRAATRTAWGLVNDALFCPRALSMPPPAVACAAIRIAARAHGGERRLKWFSPCRKRKRKTVVCGDGVRSGGGGNSESGRDIGGERPVMMNTGDGVNSEDIAGPERNNDAGGMASRGIAENVIESAKQDEVGKAGGSKPPVADELSGGTSVGVDGVAASASPGEDGFVRGKGTFELGDNGELNGEVSDDQQPSMPWWELFDAKDEEVELVCTELLSLYSMHDIGGQVVEGTQSLLSSKNESHADG